MAETVETAVTQGRSQIFQGTELKFSLDIQIEGFSMVDDDFFIVIRNGVGKSVTIQKSAMLLQEDEKFLFTVDTEELGTGKYTIITTAFVPDGDFEDGLRTEVDKRTLCEVEQ